MCVAVRERKREMKRGLEGERRKKNEGESKILKEEVKHREEKRQKE